VVRRIGTESPGGVTLSAQFLCGTQWQRHSSASVLWEEHVSAVLFVSVLLSVVRTRLKEKSVDLFVQEAAIAAGAQSVAWKHALSLPAPDGVGVHAQIACSLCGREHS